MNHLVSNECYFKDIEYHIRKKLTSAKKNIKICVSWINLIKYQNLLLEKIAQGITVDILCNEDFNNRSNHKNASLEIKKNVTYVKNFVHNHLMHNKFCIIDDSILISGSYNWSDRAKLHYENIIIIQNDFSIIKKFKHTFSDLMYMAKMSQYEHHNITFDTHKIPKELNLGTLSNSYGCLNTVSLQTWRINISNNTYKRLPHSIDVPHFFESIEFDISPDDYHDKKDYFNDLFDHERRRSSQIQDYFKKSPTQVHAIGYAAITNQQAHIEYNEEPEHGIHFSWVDMRLKNALPSTIEAEGDLNSLWEEIYY